MVEIIKYCLHLIKRCIQHLTLSLILLGCIGVPIGTYGIYTFMEDFASQIDYTLLNNFEFYGQRVKMLDEDGHIIKTYLDQKDTEKLDIKEARRDYINLVVTIEDKRFYEHKGVDFKGILRAVKVNLTDGDSSQGASTLTQQLVRSQVLTTDKTITRKLTEIFLALELEKQKTKDEILEMYLNTSYFGYGNYGIQSASKFYYGVDFDDLTLSQLCSLIPIAQSPNNFNPINNIELNNQKRTTVIKALYQEQVITESECTKALSDESYKDVKMSRDEYNKSVTSIDSYYVESAYEQVIGDLILYKELTREQAINFLKDNGCLIYTYYDEEIENMLTTLAEARFGAVDNEIQTAVAIINDKGQVKGLLGGYGKKPTNYSLNRATQSTRSPGSTFKPVAVYTTVIEKLNYTSSTIVIDEKREYPTQTGWYAPNNYNDQYIGEIPLYTAVAKSINSVAVDLLYKVGAGTGFENAKNLGITTLVANRNGYSDKGLSTALGGLTDGVIPLDMAVAYSSIKTSNNVLPRMYKKVIDRDGNLILFTDDIPKYQPKQVLNGSTSAYMLDALREVVTEGTGRLLKDAKTTVVGKTGTTNDEKDLWFVGCTPNYTISLWYGYDTPKQIPTSNKHVTLYKEIVNQLVDLGKETPDGKFKVTVKEDVYDKLVHKNIFEREEPTEESKPIETVKPTESTEPIEINTDYKVVEPQETDTPEEILSEENVVPTDDTGTNEDAIVIESTSPKPIITPEQEEPNSDTGYDSGDIFGDSEVVHEPTQPTHSETPLPTPTLEPTSTPTPEVEPTDTELPIDNPIT